MGKGFFIVIEGIDGAGLTTNSIFLTEWLRKLGFNSYYTKEPTKGPIGLCIREMLKSDVDPFILTLLFTADREAHVKKEILPKINEGFIVVCDRYMYSTLAYQSVHGMDERMIRKLNRHFPKPDMVILLDIDPSISLARKGEIKELYEKKEFLEKVRLKFLEIASDEGFIVIPSNRKLELVQNDIKFVIEYFLEEVGLLK